MSHQPFETWILDHEALSAEDRRALKTHLAELLSSANASTGAGRPSTRSCAPARWLPRPRGSLSAGKPAWLNAAPASSANRPGESLGSCLQVQYLSF